jgi:hypothetical protein
MRSAHSRQGEFSQSTRDGGQASPPASTINRDSTSFCSLHGLSASKSTIGKSCSDAPRFFLLEQCSQLGHLKFIGNTGLSLHPHRSASTIATSRLQSSSCRSGRLRTSHSSISPFQSPSFMRLCRQPQFHILTKHINVLDKTNAQEQHETRNPWRKPSKLPCIQAPSLPRGVYSYILHRAGARCDDSLRTAPKHPLSRLNLHSHAPITSPVTHPLTLNPSYANRSAARSYPLQEG